MRNLTAGIIFILLGILLLLDNLEIADFGDVIKHFWPLLLIIWGLSIVMRRKHWDEATPHAGGQEVDSELLRESSVFGNVSLNIGSKNFKGGSVSTIFGDSSIDLSQATAAEGEHILRISSVFGSTLLLLPRDSGASITASALFGELNIFGQRKGGFSSDLRTTTPNYGTASNRLNITISKVFGDLKIH